MALTCNVVIDATAPDDVLVSVPGDVVSLVGNRRRQIEQTNLLMLSPYQSVGLAHASGGGYFSSDWQRNADAYLKKWGA